MTRKELVNTIREKKSYLCVGLDTDVEKIPSHLRSQPDAVLQFNKQIIDATSEFCVAYKINTAFYEVHGSKGWDVMQQTAEYIPSTHFKIADAKRGDIGNTSARYAKAFFETLNFDAITVTPYMGADSIQPFLDYKNKWTIVLGLTSNKGSEDFEQLKTGDEYLYQKVLRVVSKWGNNENLMFVIGATKASDLKSIRQIVPDNFLLIPGIGAQGGSLSEVSKYGLNEDCGVLVNASRAIIYAGDGEDFAEEAGKIAQNYRTEMMVYF
ncbi:MAG: orotidine-5'-phosphate decarboxylase [Ginsengibacter sp.]